MFGIFQLIKQKALSFITKPDMVQVIIEKESQLMNEITQVQPTEVTSEVVQEPVVEIATNQEPKWQTWFPFSFFFGNGKFQPIYAWVFIFCILSASMLFVKIFAAWKAVKYGTYTSDMISTADIATILTFVSSLILLYNQNKKNYTSQ